MPASQEWGRLNLDVTAAGTWRLRDGRGIVGATDADSAAARAVSELIGRAVASVKVVSTFGDTVIEFEDGAVLELAAIGWGGPTIALHGSSTLIDSKAV